MWPEPKGDCFFRIGGYYKKQMEKDHINRTSIIIKLICVQSL